MLKYVIDELRDIMGNFMINDIWINIFIHLDKSTLIKLVRVCKLFNNIIKNDFFWKFLFRTYGFDFYKDYYHIVNDMKMIKKFSHIIYKPTSILTKCSYAYEKIKILNNDEISLDSKIFYNIKSNYFYKDFRGGRSADNYFYWTNDGTIHIKHISDNNYHETITIKENYYYLDNYQSGYLSDSLFFVLINSFKSKIKIYDYAANCIGKLSNANDIFRNRNNKIKIYNQYIIIITQEMDIFVFDKDDDILIFKMKLPVIDSDKENAKYASCVCKEIEIYDNNVNCHAIINVFIKSITNKIFIIDLNKKIDNCRVLTTRYHKIFNPLCKIKIIKSYIILIESISEYTSGEKTSRVTIYDIMTKNIIYACKFFHSYVKDYDISNDVFVALTNNGYYLEIWKLPIFE